MNWLAWSGRSYASMLVGCVLGFYVFGLLQAHGIEAPWIVGLSAGGSSALVSSETSGMRGISIGCIAVWVAAAAEAHYAPVRPGAGILEGLVAFSDRLTLARFFLYALCLGTAAGLGATSLRKSATTRLAGA
jgi:hypothetical protein